MVSSFQIFSGSVRASALARLALVWFAVIASPAMASNVGTTQPTTEPTTRPVDISSISQALSELDNPDADIRDAARTELMRMTRSDLLILQHVLEHGRPLAPSQAATLKQIVREVYLASEDYTKDPTNTGFLGILMDESAFNARDAQQPNDGSQNAGVVVEDRIPGFCASRMLRDGDIILGTSEPGQIFYSAENLKTAIAGLEPGAVVQLQVLREGQLIEVRIVLDARPIEAGSVDLAERFRADRNKKFEDYWQSTFANLVRDRLG